MKRQAIVLAAGKGSRLQSEKKQLPKVLREARGKALLSYVLEHLSFLPKEDLAIVVGFMAEKVRAHAGEEYSYYEQKEQLGTGHAVQMAQEFLDQEADADVLICYGDMPLISEETYRGMFEQRAKSGAEACILAYDTDLPLAYGRIIRDAEGHFQEVVEERDCTEEQKKIQELNAGVYVFKARQLARLLAKLKNNNAQQEYYLTDLPALVLAEGGRVEVFKTRGRYEGFGVNTEEELAIAERELAAEEA